MENPLRDKRKVVVLPGTSSPAEGRYVGVYAALEEEAERRGCDFRIASYPGQLGLASGVLSVRGAVEQAVELCDAFEPHWIIGRSFGCVVAAAVLSGEGNWIERCEGAVLWGPGLNATLFRMLPTPEKRRAAAAEYQAWNTFLAPDLFDTIPHIENLVRGVRCNVRFARGSRDRNNMREELDFLSALHRRMQPEYLREVVEISGLGHEVVREETSDVLLSIYMDVIFGSISSRS